MATWVKTWSRVVYCNGADGGPGWIKEGRRVEGEDGGLNNEAISLRSMGGREERRDGGDGGREESD